MLVGVAVAAGWVLCAKVMSCMFLSYMCRGANPNLELANLCALNVFLVFPQDIYELKISL